MELPLCGEEKEMSESENIGSELYRVFAYLARQQVQKRTAASARGEEGLLQYLAYQKDGVSSGFLKEQLCVSSGRMADILKSLEEKQMIYRTLDPEDSRRVLVHITAVGRGQAARTSERIRAWYEKLTDYLGEEDSRELIRIIRKLNEFRFQE